MDKLIVITGTNASGKSGLGIRLARHYGTEIVSADSRQVFRGLDLGSGKVTPEEMMEFIDKATPDCRNVVTEIQNTLTWAMGLTTRACWMYGKWCAGGKPLSAERKRTIALSALEKKGITKLPGFVDAWNMSLDVYGMGHPRVKAK